MRYLAVAIAMFALWLTNPVESVQAAGCDDGNTPNVIQVQHGIYECDGQVSENFPFGHVYAPHLAGAQACVERLADLDLRASPAFFALGSSAATGGALVSTFCQDLLYVGDGPNECSYWGSSGATDIGAWPEANHEACAQWAAVAFSESSVAVYIGDGAVDLPLTGPQRIHGAAEDNPAQDVIRGVGCPDGCPKDVPLALPEYVDDPHEFDRNGESVGGTPDVLVAEVSDEAIVLQIKPPSAGSGGLLGQGKAVDLLAIAAISLITFAVLTYATVFALAIQWGRRFWH